MYISKGGNGNAEKMNGMMTPVATPPASEGLDKQLTSKLAKTRLSDGTSSEEANPKVLATEPVGTPDFDESLEKQEKKWEEKKLKVEDGAEQTENRESDIYAQKVLACKS